jgi:hypothetical protein
MTRDELTEADRLLLAEIWEAAVLGEELPRNPAWGEDYQPLVIIANPRAYPEHADVALVNLRIARHPAEHWAKCSGCSRIYLVRPASPGDTVCSAECWEDYKNFLAAQAGVPFGLWD